MSMADNTESMWYQLPPKAACACVTDKSMISLLVCTRLRPCAKYVVDAKVGQDRKSIEVRLFPTSVSKACLPCLNAASCFVALDHINQYKPFLCSLLLFLAMATCIL